MCNELLQFTFSQPLHSLDVNFYITPTLMLIFSAFVVAEDGSFNQEPVDTSRLLQKCTGSQVDIERVSTGTKHALHQWLLKTLS